MSIWAIIPARSGSKGIKHKNIRMLHGQPLMTYTILAAKKAQLIDRIFVSTDSKEYATIAIKQGAEVPFLRPQHLATDTASTGDVVLDLLEQLQESMTLPTWTILLQPTSPLRTEKHIDEALQLLQSNPIDAVVSVKEVEEHPYAMKLIRDQFMVPFIKDDELPTRRQDYPPLYILNGAIYAFKTDALLRQRSLNFKLTLPYLMGQLESIDIDTAFDFYLAETILQGKYTKWLEQERL